VHEPGESFAPTAPTFTIGRVGAPDSLLTTAQAARLLGVTPAHVRRLASRGELAYETTPYGRLYPRADVERRRARPPRSGRPAARRMAPARAPALPPADDRVAVYVEREATVSDSSGTWHYPAGRPYLVSAAHAEALVREGFARRLG
jgi:excisionase family DNA binding protein